MFHKNQKMGSLEIYELNKKDKEYSLDVHKVIRYWRHNVDVVMEIYILLILLSQINFNKLKTASSLVG